MTTLLTAVLVALVLKLAARADAAVERLDARKGA